MIRALPFWAMLAAPIAFTAYLFIASATSTGPNCPGMDPDWIGYCEEPAVGSAE